MVVVLFGLFKMNYGMLQNNCIPSKSRVIIYYCTTFGRDAMALQHPAGVISSQGAKKYSKCTFLLESVRGRLTFLRTF